MFLNRIITCICKADQLHIPETKVLKPGSVRPVRPVEPTTGRRNGPVNPLNPMNTSNRTEPSQLAVQPRTCRTGASFDEPGRVFTCINRAGSSTATTPYDAERTIRVAMKQSVKILVAIVGDNELFLWLLFWFLSLGFSSSLFHGGGRFGGVVTGPWWWWIR